MLHILIRVFATVSTVYIGQSKIDFSLVNLSFDIIFKFPLIKNRYIHFLNPFLSDIKIFHLMTDLNYVQLSDFKHAFVIDHIPP